MTTNDESSALYRVLVNHEGQYCVWLADRTIPLGWTDAGKSGAKAECLDYIGRVWTDMSPLSAREQADERQKSVSASK